MRVPAGAAPAIDGVIDAAEWANATVETFSDGTELLLLQNAGYLYLGLRANVDEMIVGNVFINRGDQVFILHSSAALGTAIYQQQADLWEQTKPFAWCCRGTGNTPGDLAEREDFFAQEGWVSVNSRVGTPHELEYQIEIGEAPVYLAVNYLRVSSDPNDEKTAWPSDIQDDVKLPTPGGLPLQFHFNPQSWASLNFADQ